MCKELNSYQLFWIAARWTAAPQIFPEASWDQNIWLKTDAVHLQYSDVWLVDLAVNRIQIMKHTQFVTQ